MNQQNHKKPSFFTSWLIKKIINNESSKEEILNLIANENSSDEHLNSYDDNNEKSLIKNILQLESKSVEERLAAIEEQLEVTNKYMSAIDWKIWLYLKAENYIE